MEITDTGFTQLLKRGNVEAFKKVFTTYYSLLYHYAFTIIPEEAIAEEIVQNVFFKLWLKKDKLEILHSVKAYLYKSIHNECMDQLKKRRYRGLFISHMVNNNKNLVSGEDAGRKVEMNELEKELRKALNDLPNDCRTIFQLSRFEGLKYRQIADQLGLSIKTVEAQMGKALKRLRVSLAEFLSLLIFFLWIQ